MPIKEFEIFEEDFAKTAMDYLLFEQNVDVKQFTEDIASKVLYSSVIVQNDESVSIILNQDEKG